MVCLTNGLDCERQSLRTFPRTYAMLPFISGGHTVPGEVALYGAPPRHAWLPVGRYPEGTDDVSDRIAADLRNAGFRSESDPDVMVKKRTKLLANLGNAMAGVKDAGSAAGVALMAAAREEALAVYAAAGLRTMDRDALEADWRSTTKSGNDVTIEGVGLFQGCELDVACLSFTPGRLSSLCVRARARACALLTSMACLVSLFLFVAAELR